MQRTRSKTPSSMFTDEYIMDILVTAIEGGCDHWMDDVVEYNPDSHAIIIADDGAGTVSKFTINADIIRHGIDLLAKSDLFWHYADLLKENYDAATADVILQLALFGEVVYG